MITNKLLRLSLPVLAGALCMIALLSLMTAVTERLNAFPRVGDMVAFTPTDILSPMATARLPVQRTDQKTCVLDLTTLHSSGGSLFVESRSASGFVVHWAGVRTSDDGADCGAGADLFLDRDQIETLNAAAHDYVPGLRPVWLPGKDGV